MRKKPVKVVKGLYELHRESQKILQDAILEAIVDGNGKRAKELQKLKDANEKDFKEFDKTKLSCPNCEYKAHVSISISNLAICPKCKVPYSVPVKLAT
jgi:hypothetical protein